MAGEPLALVGSFAGEPELHDPVRGRVRGARAFEAYATEQCDWLRRMNFSVERVERVVGERRGFEELMLHLDGEAGRVDLPFAIVADRSPDGRRIEELRIYFSPWTLTGRRAVRPPLLQPDPELRLPDVVGDYQRGLAAGDVEAIAAAFEHGAFDAGRRARLERLLAGGGIPLEHCATVDDGRVCGLEYNVVRWGGVALPPQAGFAAYVRGESGRLAASRVYDDVEPPSS
jgi:hypothetical protein